MHEAAPELGARDLVTRERPAPLPRGKFFGRRLRSSELAGLTLTEYRYRAGLRLTPHQHEHAYLSVVLAGAYDETVEGRERRCRTGTVTYHPAGERHADTFGSRQTRIFSVELESSWLDRQRIAPQPADPEAWHGGPLQYLALRLYREFGEQDDVTPIAVEGLALEVVAELARARRSTPAGRRPAPWLGRVRDRIADEPGAALSLRALAAEAGVHPVHLVREFRKHFGTTVARAIRGRRIDLACELLRDTDQPLAQVALVSGFAHQSHFSSVFRRRTGLSPGEYRRRLHGR